MTISSINGQPGGEHVTSLLPEYLNETLDASDREHVGVHLSQCAGCRAELRTWQVIADATCEAFSASATAAPSVALLDAVWARVYQSSWQRLANRLHPSRRSAASTARVALAQARLIPMGIWVLSAAALLVAFIGMVFWHIGAYPHSILGAFVPLITAVGIAFIYGPEYDESLEITLSTPVSPRLVLVSRVALVFAYNFALGLILTLALVLLHGDDFSVLIAYWAGPTLLLAGLSLLLSLTISSLTGIACVAVLWLVRFVGAAFELPGTMLTSSSGPLTAIWQTSLVTVVLACALVALAVFYVPYQRRLKA
jgi:Putative zinc-finger